MGGRWRFAGLLLSVLPACAGKSTTRGGEAGAASESMAGSDGGAASGSGGGSAGGELGENAGAPECPYPPSDAETACTTWEDCTWVLMPACCAPRRAVGYAIGHECAPSPITCTVDCAMDPVIVLDIEATVLDTQRIFAMCDTPTHRCISYTEAPPIP